MKTSLDIIFLFAIWIVFFSTIVIFYNSTIPEEVYAMIYVFPIIAVSLLSFMLAKQYKKIKTFCVGHIFLGISMLSYLAAETMWIILVHFGHTPYPSLTDVLYGLYFIFAILHPIAILKFFEIKPKKLHYILFGLIVIISLAIYGVFSSGGDDPETFLIGLIFITLTSTLFGVSVLTILSIRGRKIFRIWIIIGIAFLINSITDIHYYIFENYYDWDIGYLGNIVWFTSNMILFYALLEHRNKYRVLQND